MNELLIGSSSFTERTNMSILPPEILLNGQLAKRRLDEVFDMTDSGRPSSPITGQVPVTPDGSEPVQRQRRARDLASSRDIFGDSTRKQSRPKRSSQSDSDMTASCFILTLLLIATIIAVYTDRPVFWLLMGPVPLAAGFALLACFQTGRLIMPYCKTPRCKSGSSCSA
jgi:uncharacterized integral membrane protein